MPDSPSEYPNHGRIDLPDVHFEGLDDDTTIIVMPSAYLPDRNIPPPEVMQAFEAMQRRHPEKEIQIARIDLYTYAPCAVCGQECAILPPASADDGFARVCWDCVEEQNPGFIEKAMAGKFQPPEEDHEPK